MIRESDVILAPTPQEAGQLVGLYGADPDGSGSPPGVDHSIFPPRTAGSAGAAAPGPAWLALFVGRLQSQGPGRRDPDARRGRGEERRRRRGPRARDRRRPERRARGRGGRAADGARRRAGRRRPRCCSRRSPTNGSPTSTRPPTSCWCRRGRSPSGSSRWRRRRAGPRWSPPRSAGSAPRPRRRPPGRGPRPADHADAVLGSWTTRVRRLARRGGARGSQAFVGRDDDGGSIGHREPLEGRRVIHGIQVLSVRSRSATTADRDWQNDPEVWWLMDYEGRSRCRHRRERAAGAEEGHPT